MNDLKRQIKLCDEYIKKGKTKEERKIRKEFCKPAIEEAKKLHKEHEKREKEMKKEQKKMQEKASIEARQLEEIKKMMRRAYGDRE